MPEGRRITLIFIIIICLLALFLGSGIWDKFNAWFDKWHLEQEFGERGDLIIKNGMKFWKPEGGIK